VSLVTPWRDRYRVAQQNLASERRGTMWEVADEKEKLSHRKLNHDRFSALA